jgi:hypothetical protein
MRVKTLIDQIEELRGQSWRDEPAVVRVRQVLEQQRLRRQTLADQCAVQRQSIAEATVADALEEDRAVVGRLLGRAATAVRNIVAPPQTLVSRLEQAEAELAAADRQIALLEDEQQRVEFAAKRQRAVVLAELAAPLLPQLIALVDQARTVNQALHQLHRLALSEFEPGTPHGLLGAFSFLPAGSKDPAFGHFYQPLVDDGPYHNWRHVMRRTGVSE